MTSELELRKKFEEDGLTEAEIEMALDLHEANNLPKENEEEDG